ncbi:MAG: hypothetical protein AMJ65_19050 [Phycisphaerae bacterium SG8_4]|nr:MAG: hypothetical protein AMJ65_19050 [Phycisphaerae bacterium SG8_4]
MKTSRLKASCILLSLLTGLGFLIPGYGKASQSASTPDPAATEKEFLSDPDTAICELEKTTIYSLGISKNRQPSFIRRMERANRQDLKQAKITVANREFKVLLGERPEREFFLFDVEKDFGPYWWGSWSLHSHHKIGDQFFEFMLVEDGAKIAGRPYKGELGTIKVGKGGRDLEKVEFNGSVEKAGYVSAPVGNIKDRWPDPVGKCEIPVGDYTANIMDVIYDKLHITISNNYHTNAQGQSGAGRETVYGMRVRKDKPYVLDFTNKPMVIFDEPSGNRPCSRGDQIKFAAVMIDPKLDIMIRRLNDTSVMVDKEYKDGSGKVIHTAKRPKSLDPKVVIARDDGEIVAEGVMPFG